jgi:chemotaxis protein methyltransferase CheR
VSSLAPSDSPAPPTEHPLTDREFEALSALVASHTGIALGRDKRALLQARLSKRLRALSLSTFTEYHRLLTAKDTGGEELARFINAVTTNKTGFFREAHHFSYLRERWIPRLEARAGRGADRIVRIWSAGCSSGEEPYTIAITLMDALRDAAAWNVRILASDIDTDVLQRAEAAIYSLDDVETVPRASLYRHFLRGTAANPGLVRVRAELRRLVTFRRINLLDEAWPIRATFDVIFCRNVLIYFDRSTQARVLERLIRFVKDDGLLVLGHSESVHGLVEGVRPAGHTIYRKEGATCPPPS